MRGQTSVSAVEVTGPHGGQRRGITVGVTITVSLGSPPVNEAVAVVAPQQLGHGDHGHVLLEAEVGVHHPGPLAADVKNYLGGPLFKAALVTGMFLQELL